MSGLGSIKFAEVVHTAAKGKPSISVRANGTLVANDEANAIVGYSEDKKHFRVGVNGTGDGLVYLVPAKEDEEGAIKATKNGDSFMFKQADVFANLGVTEKTKFAVSAETDEETQVAYFLLTPNTKKETPAASGDTPPAEGDAPQVQS